MLTLRKYNRLEHTVVAGIARGVCVRFAKRVPIVVAVVMLLGAGIHAAPQPHATSQPVASKLTPRLRKLLVSEMVSLRGAAQGILDGLMAGDDPSVARLAQGAHDSFIMEKSMTPQDRNDLRAALPKKFMAMDESFHETAGKLAEAAKERERTREYLLFDRMIRACASCHSRYASDVFTGFAVK